jgi:hypothetical protein
MIDLIAADKLARQCYRCQWDFGTGWLCDQRTRFIIVSGRRKYARLCPGHGQLATRR